MNKKLKNGGICDYVCLGLLSSEWRSTMCSSKTIKRCVVDLCFSLSPKVLNLGITFFILVNAGPWFSKQTLHVFSKYVIIMLIIKPFAIVLKGTNTDVVVIQVNFFQTV